MAHVTFIHGISNKPPAKELLRIWRAALDDAADPLPLGDLNVTSTMVYWADLLYEKAEEDLSAYEGVLENSAEAIDGAGAAPPPVPRTPEEAAFLEGLRAKMTTLSEAELATAEPPPVPAQPQGALERVPLPWFIKKRFLNAYLRDVHHYLFDVEYAPAGGTPVRIQETIRKRFVEAVGGSDLSRPHVVVSHSMGTVIAYDCLKRVTECVPVDGLITIGSPLGVDEVQDKLQPGWSRADGFPHERIEGGWVNLFDRLDPVCGFDPVLANDFRKGGTASIEDVAVKNEGTWRHSATKYLRQPSFCSALRRMLDARARS
jgi:hypothetical protein